MSCEGTVSLLFRYRKDESPTLGIGHSEKDLLLELREADTRIGAIEDIDNRVGCKSRSNEETERQHAHVLRAGTCLVCAISLGIATASTRWMFFYSIPTTATRCIDAVKLSPLNVLGRR